MQTLQDAAQASAACCVCYTSGSCAAQSTKGSQYHACRFVVAHGCTGCCGMLVRSSRQLWELFTRSGWCLRVPAHSIILASNFTRIDNLVSRRSGGLEIPALWSSGVLGISKLAGSSPVGRLAADPTEQQASPAAAECWIRVGIMLDRENCLSAAVYRQNHAQDSRGSGESL